MGSQRVRHDWSTELNRTFNQSKPIPVSLPEQNSSDDIISTSSWSQSLGFLKGASASPWLAPQFLPFLSLGRPLFSLERADETPVPPGRLSWRKGATRLSLDSCRTLLAPLHDSYFIMLHCSRVYSHLISSTYLIWLISSWKARSVIYR